MTMMFGAPAGAVARGGHQPSEPANVRPTATLEPCVRRGAVGIDGCVRIGSLVLR